ncbi:MAG: Mobile element protein [Ilumatobacteraceae bacterium]|nr:Mobile element protein [Ilumatobacteraceae bacterium]
MSHRNARLTVHGRRLLVYRVREQGHSVAHVAKAMACHASARIVGSSDSTPRVMRVWRIARRDRTRCRRAPVLRSNARVLDARVAHRKGQDWLGPELGCQPERCRGSCVATTSPGCATATR